MINRDNIPNENDIKIIAPGQGKRPISWNQFPYIDELVFPTIYGGHFLNYDKKKISLSKRYKSEIRKVDRRATKPTSLLFKAKRKLDNDVFKSIITALRKRKKTDKLTAKDVLNPEIISELYCED